MSCQECEYAQGIGAHTFIRIGNGNVKVSGCDKHLKEMFDMIRAQSSRGRLQQ